MHQGEGVQPQSTPDGDLDKTLSAGVGWLGVQRSESVELIRWEMEETWMERTRSGCDVCRCGGVAQDLGR